MKPLRSLLFSSVFLLASLAVMPAPAGRAAIVYVDPPDTFLTGAQPAPAFRTAGTEILGVEFANSTTGALNYGWVEFTTTGTTGFPATLNRFAHENAGLSILAGAVPEPSTWALLGVGAVVGGGAVLRRRRVAS